MEISAAMFKAQELGLDLVEVSPNTNPPVCKIMDLGKFIYQQEKQAKIAKKNQVIPELKEIKFRPGTDENDYQTKLRHINRFISNGDRCKIVLVFRGRENQFKKDNNLFERIKTDITNIKVIQEPKEEGKAITMVIG